MKLDRDLIGHAMKKLYPLIGFIVVLFFLITLLEVNCNAGDHFRGNENSCLKTVKEYGNYFFINHCNKKLNVKWYDANECRRGCSVNVPAGGKSIIGGLDGRVTLGACVWPAIPSFESSSDGSYRCIGGDY